MNIIEAIKSGKPFKRSSWNRDYVKPPFVNLNLAAEDLLAYDWEVERTPVAITHQQFWDAFKKAKETLQHPDSYSTIEVCRFMEEELGL